MERVESLIHKIKDQYENGAAKSTILVTLEELKGELMLSLNVPEPVPQRVSVWLPAGYAPKVVHPAQAEPTAEGIYKVEEPVKPKVQLKVPSESLIYQTQIAENADLPTERAIAEISPIPNYTAPKPPVVAHIEESPEDDASLSEIQKASTPVVEFELNQVQTTETLQTASKEPDATPTLVTDEKIIEIPVGEANTPIETEELEIREPSKPLVFQFGVDTNRAVELETSLEEPMVFELNDTEAWQPVSLAKPPEKSIIPEGFLQPSTLLKEPTAKPKELHEILANRVVAQEGITERKPKVISEALGGSKITDIRKAISINDRFRFIHSLFRGDENLFERTLKTINNFGILQEAQYWMQRELVIKYGWNDEDELVQQFYSLVSRRFL